MFKLILKHREFERAKSLMFWSSKDFLEICQELHELGFRPELPAGGRVSRGFADLGFEEFMFLPPDRLTSLFTGDKSTMPEEHKDFFFSVPTVDEMVDFALSLGAVVSGIEHVDQREWKVFGSFKDAALESSDKNLNVAAAKFLRSLLKDI